MLSKFFLTLPGRRKRNHPRPGIHDGSWQVIQDGRAALWHLWAPSWGPPTSHSCGGHSSLLLRYAPSALPCQWSHLVGQLQKVLDVFCTNLCWASPFSTPNFSACLGPNSEKLWQPRPLPSSVMRGPKTEPMFRGWGRVTSSLTSNPLLLGDL